MAPVTKHTVFISHAHADNDQCDAYASGLKALGLDAWYDRTNMQASNLISDVVGKELKVRTALVILLTPNSVKSGWVTIEWQTFLNYWTKEQDKRIIVPVLLTDCEVPPLLTPFNRVDLSLMTQQEAIDTIARILGVEPPPRGIVAPVITRASTRPHLRARTPRPYSVPGRLVLPDMPTQEKDEWGYDDWDDDYDDYGGYDSDDPLQQTATDAARLERALREWLSYTEEKWRAVNDSQLGWKPLRGRWHGWEDIYEDVYPSQKRGANDPMDRRFENARAKGSAASAVVGFLHDLDALLRLLQEKESSPSRTRKPPRIRNPTIVDADGD